MEKFPTGEFSGVETDMLKKLIIKEKIMAMTYGGIMYFPLNVNFFEDAPIELIEAKFGLVGEAAVMKLLCKMYKEKGYYLLWGEEQCTLFSHKTGIEKSCMEGIINILVEKDFFDKTCTDFCRNSENLAGCHQAEKKRIDATTLSADRERE